MSSPFPSFPHSQQLSRPAAVNTGRSLLKRALFGIILLALMVTGGAWLMHAGIDREAEAQLSWPDDSQADTAQQPTAIGFSRPPASDLGGSLHR